MTNKYMRLTHRYLGFFLIGIMVAYAISGVILIFRNTDFLKKEIKVERELKADLSSTQLAKELRKRNLKISKEEKKVLFF